MLPGGAATERLIHAAVVRFDEMLRVGGLDDEGVMVRVQLRDVLTPGLPTVLRDDDGRREIVDTTVVGRIYAHLTGVIRTVYEIAHAPPMRAAIVGSEDAARKASGYCRPGA